MAKQTTRQRLTSAAKATQSAAYKEAESTAADYLQDPQKIESLVTRAEQKAQHKKGGLGSLGQQGKAAFRLLKAYANGSYRAVSFSSMLTLIASVLYFLMPFDVLPDFIFGIGLLDDAAVLAWALRSLRGEIADFLEWESKKSPR